MNVTQILKSDNVFIASLFDLEGITDIMNKVAALDDLPQTHTQEALLLLRRAWCIVELYAKEANFYKRLTKVSYFLLLILGVGVVFRSTYMANEMGFSEFEENDPWLLGLTVASTAVAGYIGFMNPAGRWHQLRSAGLTVESEIWKFRTRREVYAVDKSTLTG